METQIGILHRIHELGAKSCTVLFAFEHKGEWEPVRVCDSIADVVPTEQLIALSFVEGVAVDWEELPVPSAMPDITNKDIAIVLVRSQLQPGDEELVKTRAKRVENALKARFRTRWDIRVTGYVYESDCNVSIYSNCFERAKNHLRTQGHDVDKHIYWQLWGGSWPQVCGHGSTPGTRSVVYMTSQGCSHIDVAVHELGHNFRWGHSGDEWGEYNDSSCVLGNAKLQQGFHAGRFHDMGHISDYHQRHIAQSEIVFLAPVEYEDPDMRDGELRVATISAPTGLYYLSTRATVGYYTLSHVLEDTFFAHQTDGPSPAWTLLRGRRSDRFENLKTPVSLANGITVRVLDKKDGVMKVRVDMGDGINPPDRPFPTETWLPPAPADPLEKRHTGIWYDPFFSGQGLVVEVRDTDCIVYWFTWEPHTEQMMWYLCLGNIDNGIARLEVYKGTAQTPADLQKVGNAELYFHTDLAGIFKWNCDGIRRGHYNLLRLAPTNMESPLHGSWYDPKETGSGFSFSVVQREEGEELVGYYYTYKSSKHQWYDLYGMLGDSQDLELSVYSYSGGRLIDPREVTSVKVGTANLNVETMKLQALGKTLDLERVFDPQKSPQPPVSG